MDAIYCICVFGPSAVFYHDLSKSKIISTLFTSVSFFMCYDIPIERERFGLWNRRPNPTHEKEKPKRTEERISLTMISEDYDYDVEKEKLIELHESKNY